MSKETAGEENSGLPYALQECSTGRIGIAQQTCPDEQASVILFWISNEMILKAAAKGGVKSVMKILELMDAETGGRDYGSE